MSPVDKHELDVFVEEENRPKKIQKCKKGKTQCMEDDGMRLKVIKNPGKRTRLVKTFLT